MKTTLPGERRESTAALPIAKSNASRTRGDHGRSIRERVQPQQHFTYRDTNGNLEDAWYGNAWHAQTGRWQEMNEMCDRCGPAAGAGYRVDRVDRAGELYLCGPCATRHWRALSAQGWTFWPLGVHALAPQALAAARGRPVQDAA